MTKSSEKSTKSVTVPVSHNLEDFRASILAHGVAFLAPERDMAYLKNAFFALLNAGDPYPYGQIRLLIRGRAVIASAVEYARSRTEVIPADQIGVAAVRDGSSVYVYPALQALVDDFPLKSKCVAADLVGERSGISPDTDSFTLTHIDA